MLLMTLGRGISWSINGVPCRIDPRQRHRMARRYDEPVARWLASHVKPGDFCANVGGNVGVYALQFAHWTGPDGRVVVFEPNPHARTIRVSASTLWVLPYPTRVEKRRSLPNKAGTG
jgi:hypothetical protein